MTSAKCDIVRLGDVCKVVSGSTPKTSVSEFWGGEFPWITPAELKGEVIIVDTERKLTQKGVDSCSLKIIPKGTVLLTSRAPIGKVAIAGCDMYCNQGFKNLICGERVYNRYLFYWLRSHVEYLNSLGRGATFKEISKTIVEGVQIPLPPLAEQKRIAEELDNICAAKKDAEAIVEKLKLLAKSLFVEMFGDPITAERFPKLELQSLLEANATVSYGIVQTGPDVEGGVPVFRPVDITGGMQPRRSQLKRTTSAISESYKRTLLCGNEVLITVRASIGDLFQVTSEFKGCNVGRGITPLRFDRQRIDPKFAIEQMRYPSMSRHIRSLARGVTLIKLGG